MTIAISTFCRLACGPTVAACLILWSTQVKGDLAASTLVSPAFAEGMGNARVKGRWMLLDVSGRTTEVKEPVDDISFFSEGLARYRIAANYGFINKKATVAIAAGFSDAGHFSEGLAPVAVRLPDGPKRWGFIDQQGSFVIRPRFENAAEFSGGLAAVKMDGKWGYIDVNDEFRIRPQFEDAHSFADGLAAVLVEQQWGYIQTNGEFRVQPAYAEAGPFHDGYATVVNPLGKGTNWFNVIDVQGKVLFKKDKPWCGAVVHGRVPVLSDGGIEFYTIEGSTSRKYIAARDYREGLAPIRTKVGGGWGFINLADSITVPAEYEQVFFFNEGVAFVKKNGQWQLIDHANKIIWRE